VKNMKVEDIKPGTIVRYQGVWGVLGLQGHYRWLDTWHNGRFELLKQDIVVVPSRGNEK
jgi:hypothetical protein